MNWFTAEVKRPDLWAIPLVCSNCGWRVSPEGPWRHIDVMFPPRKCPKCSHRLILARMNCPECGDRLPAVRWPTSMRQARWGGYTCKHCACEIDKWGRKIADCSKQGCAVAGPGGTGGIAPACAGPALQTMIDDNLEFRIRALIAKSTGFALEKITSTTDAVRDTRIDGDDIDELVAEFGQQFRVDVSGYRWYHHGGPEGCNPLWLFYKPWWSRKTYVPMRICDLVESARRGTWVIQYPEDERMD